MQSQLTDRQERFVHEYLIDQNAAAAARRCGYSAKTGGAQANQLMRNPLVHARIRAGLAALFSELNITALRLLRQRALTAFFDPRKLFDAAGRPIPFHQLDEESAAAVIVSYSGADVIRVRQANRNAALSALERRYAQFLAMQMNGLGDEMQEQAAPEMGAAFAECAAQAPVPREIGRAVEAPPAVGETVQAPHDLRKGAEMPSRAVEKTVQVPHDLLKAAEASSRAIGKAVQAQHGLRKTAEAPPRAVEPVVAMPRAVMPPRPASAASSTLPVGKPVAGATPPGMPARAHARTGPAAPLCRPGTRAWAPPQRPAPAATPLAGALAQVFSSVMPCAVARHTEAAIA
jgi:phage terminase small subunit